MQRARSPYFIQLRRANGSGYQSMNALLEQSDVAATSKSMEELSNLESRDYETEEQEFAELQARAAAKAVKKHRRPPTHGDKAYKPTASDYEESGDDDVSDGGTRRRKRKSMQGRAKLDGLLPMLSAEKRRKGQG